MRKRRRRRGSSGLKERSKENGKRQSFCFHRLKPPSDSQRAAGEEPNTFEQTMKEEKEGATHLDGFGSRGLNEDATQD